MNDDTMPAMKMLRMITGYWVTQIIHGAAVAGYAERLHEGQATAEDLATHAGMNPSAVFRHLRACGSLGLVTFDGRTFKGTPLLDVLRRDHPQSVRGFALSQPAPGHWLPWGRFVESLRSGELQTIPALGSELFDYYSRTPSEAEAFTEAMEGMTAVVTSEAVRILDTTGIGRAVDVGGASGALLASLLEANPTLQGTLFDLPHVVDGHAFTNIPDSIRGRIDKVGGDFFNSVPSADLYLLKWILHDWNDQQCVTILRNCRSAIRPGGQVAIVELVLGEIGEESFAPLMDINMLVMMRGRERSLRDYADLLAKAGFGEVEITPTASPMAVITAKPIG